MVYKGCQRRVVYIKDLGTDLFDGAYFIVKSDAENHKAGDDIVRAAGELVQKSIGETVGFSDRKKKKDWRMFFGGIGVGVFCALMFLLLV